MPSLVRVLALPLAMCAVLAACSSSSGSGPATSPASSPAGTSATAVSTTPSSAAPSSTAGTSTAGTSTGSTDGASTAAVRPAPGGGSTITFEGKVSGTMKATACQGGIAQLAVDIDGQGSTFPGIIDADDFTFEFPKVAGFTLAKGAAKPRVGGGGTTFTVDHVKLIGILSTDTVTATGTVTCP